MRKIIAFVFCLVIIACKSYAQTNDGGKFKFKEDSYDFGTLAEGPIAEHKFEFTNVGNKPLIIQNATASCGCTTPKWPVEPILPGKKGVITVQYNTPGHPGPFVKQIWVQSNSVPDQAHYELQIKGTVKAAGK